MATDDNIMQVNTLPTSALSIGGSQRPGLAGRMGELVVSALHGKYYELAYNGNVFIGSTAVAGVVPPIYNNTTQQYCIFNPLGSGVNIVPLKVSLGLVTVGVVTDHFCWGYLLNCGAAIATGAKITAGSTVTPVNANLGGANAKTSQSLFLPASITCTAPSYLRNMGVTSFEATTPTAANSFWQLTEYYDGDLIVAPGTAVFISNNIAGVATWDIAVTWAEVPA